MSNIPGILRAVNGVDIDRERVVRWDLINNRAGDAGSRIIKQLLSEGVWTSFCSKRDTSIDEKRSDVFRLMP